MIRPNLISRALGAALFVLAAFVAQAHAQGAASAGDPTHGKLLYNTWCAGCHGADPKQSQPHLAANRPQVLSDAITLVTRAKGTASGLLRRVDIVGPVCETGDCFLHDWPLPPVQSGDVLAIWCAGAYGMSLASNYNMRLRAPEVLVSGKSMRLIRRRETFDDLFRADTDVPTKP